MAAGAVKNGLDERKQIVNPLRLCRIPKTENDSVLTN